MYDFPVRRHAKIGARCVHSVRSSSASRTLFFWFFFFTPRCRSLITWDLRSIKRCISSPINHRVYFSDVVFADIFTSYAKVLGDVWLSLCMLLPSGSLLAPPKQYGWYRWILPTFMRYDFVLRLTPRAGLCHSIYGPSLPYLVRFRQCIVEYTSPSNDSRRPLWNAVKYASSFPVIFLSAAQRIVVSDLIAQNGESAGEGWNSGHMLFRLWYVCRSSSSLARPFLTAGSFGFCQDHFRPRQFVVFVLVGRNQRLGL